MVYTVTLNPSLDYIMNVPSYCEGTVNRSSSAELVPGGKGINVSLVLKNLGIESTALGFVGGFVGSEIERLLNEQGIKTDFVRLVDGNSRINVKLKADAETEINALGPCIGSGEMEELYAKLGQLHDGDFLVLAGSVPSGLSDITYCDILERIANKNVRIVVDAEGELLVKTLRYKPFLIKPNHHELGAVFGRELKTKEEVAEYAEMLCRRGAMNVFVTMAGEGGVLVSGRGTIFAKAPMGKVVNSTGAGDSAVAGFVAGYIEDNDVEKAFLKGICTGSASAFSHGFADEEAVEELLRKMEGENVGRI